MWFPPAGTVDGEGAGPPRDGGGIRSSWSPWFPEVSASNLEIPEIETDGPEEDDSGGIGGKPKSCGEAERVSACGLKANENKPPDKKCLVDMKTCKIDERTCTATEAKCYFDGIFPGGVWIIQKPPNPIEGGMPKTGWGIGVGIKIRF
jgi:hypothetical protein